MTLSGSSFVLLCLVLILPLCSHSSPIRISNETDRLSLLDFKSKIVNDPFGVMASWNHSIHFCHWNGVTCGHRHRRVTVVDLSSHRLAGSISPHIGNLSFLKSLHLQNNSFTGQIPPELGRLHRLQNLHLGDNSLAEEIPANLSTCLNLNFISLSSNNLSGRIPVEFGSLMNLQVLSLYDNNLTGNVPSSFGNLSSLQTLKVGINRLGGRIPYTLGQLKNLTKLGLDDNRFEGTIPRSIFNLSSLEGFAVYQNQLNGSLPSELGNLFPNLQYFGISDNRFRGIIPPSLSNVSNIQRIFLNGNELSGQMPDLGMLHNLQVLNVGNNSLGSGREGDLSFLSTLTNATRRLRVLVISANNFGGVLPESLANLSSTTLFLLDISHNQISGRLPAGIANLKSLQVLSTWSNLLSGSIPEDIGKLLSLCYLEIHTNEFTGNIPASIGNLANLISAMLDYNMLQGSIPSSLGNCQSLQRFTISNNTITGTIPPTLFTISTLSELDLSGNMLTGALPMEIGNLKNLGRFGLSKNMLMGVIPSSLGSCVMLEVLYMEDNFFHGAIPPSFASLRGLKKLNLSRNNLSGKIPDFFKSIPFEYLDLSFNNFSGVLPSGGIFKNATVVSVEGNNMLCGATPELHLPICRSEERKKMRLTVKLKMIIIIVLSSLATFVIFISLLFWLSTKKRKGDVSNLTENSLLQVSYQTLFTATEGFSSANLIGTGGFAAVYKGILLDPRITVAVKVFHLQRRGASRSFMVECEALRSIRHRNLVKVITACSSIDSCGDDFKAIVYEFMANGNLDQWLHPAAESDDTRESTKKLTLLQRLNIAIDIACALDYLHHQYGQSPIVHCDLKPTNILLNDEMTAQVGDFGLIKFLSESINNFSTSQTSTTGLRGTIGYTAPEYGTGSEVSTYGDMYSYGILLLEMFTAKRPTDDMFNNGMNLRNYVKMALPDQVAGIADPILVQETHDNGVGSEIYQKMMESLIQIFGIGIACSEESPRERKNISDALAELILIRDKQIIHRRRARDA